jgi:tetratricopeptide (TPR) repeat protein
MELANLANLADLHLRAGDAATALELFVQAKVLRGRLAAVLEEPLPLEAGESAAAARLGLWRRAEEPLEELLAAAGEDPATAARLWAQLGALAALAGDRESAESRINQAIDLAVECGARDVLVEVAMRSGQANQLLGRTEDAGESFQKALELCGEGGLQGQAPAVAVAVTWGLFTTHEEEPEWLDATLRLLPSALVADAETWWTLEGLLDAALRLDALEPLSPESREALDLACRAARCRPDCRKHLEGDNLEHRKATAQESQVAAPGAGSRP